MNNNKTINLENITITNPFPHDIWLTILADAASDIMAFESIPKVCKYWYFLFKNIINTNPDLKKAIYISNKIIKKFTILNNLDPQIDTKIKHIYNDIPKENLTPSKTIKICDYIIMESLDIPYHSPGGYQKPTNFNESVNILRNSQLAKKFKRCSRKDQRTIFYLMDTRFRAEDPNLNHNLLLNMNLTLFRNISDKKISSYNKNTVSKCLNTKKSNSITKGACMCSVFLISILLMCCGATLAYGSTDYVLKKYGYLTLGAGAFLMTINISLFLLKKIFNRINADKEKEQYKYYGDFLKEIYITPQLKDQANNNNISNRLNNV